MLFFPGVGSYLPNNCWHQTLQLLAGFVTPLHLSKCLVSLLKGGGGEGAGSTRELQRQRTDLRVGFNVLDPLIHPSLFYLPQDLPLP